MNARTGSARHVRILAGAACAGILCPLASGADDLVVFVHDQIADEIIRMQDLNDDGDAHDPGEATVFFDDGPPVTGVDNAQGMVALGPWTLLATDNFDPDNIVRLEDFDRDGDAFDAGEASVWFSGTLPIGLAMTNPAELRLRSDGTFFLLDNNTLDTAVPEAIYILEDLNSDNDVDDPGEITTFFELSPVGVSATTTFDAIEDNSGNVYVLDITDPSQIESIDIIDPAGTSRTQWFDSVDLLNLAGMVLTGTVNELAHIADTDEIVFGASSGGGSQRIMAARDRNESGTIDTPAELRLLWSESAHADGFNTGSPRDLFLTDDGRLLWTDGLADRVMMLTDLNADGDYNDAGETGVLYDADTAVANGLPGISLALSVTAAMDDACPADLAEPFGSLNFFDVAAFIGLYNAGDPGADLAEPFGSLNIFDVAAFIGLYNAGCP